MKQTSRLGESLALAALCIAALSCSSGGTEGERGGGDDGTRGEVLASIGQNVVLPLLSSFATEAAALEGAISEASPTTEGRADAAEAWQSAMAVWQQLEMMQFGPLGSSRSVMGGQDLRARTYSWPLIDLCQVDQQTVDEGHDDPDAIEQTVAAPLGLWAIEYLLFNESLENNCTAFNPIEPEGIWEDMADMIPSRRLEYAAALATLVRRRADELVAAWSPEGGNYIAELTDPRRPGAVYGSAQEGLNAVSDAMFYLEKESKDMKVGTPIGETDGCLAPPCPEDLESRWAQWSKPHVLANLRGFQALFLGGSPGSPDALGFDDLLVDMGAQDVADDMAQAITDAIVAVEAVPGTFREALDQNPSELTAAYEAIQVVTDFLKTDFVSDLDLEAPDRAAGDND